MWTQLALHLEYQYIEGKQRRCTDGDSHAQHYHRDELEPTTSSTNLLSLLRAFSSALLPAEYRAPDRSLPEAHSLLLLQVGAVLPIPTRVL